ncbi:AAA family ATPase [Catellatospora aurea]|uniref:AAA family ATPase n=1 Tax=Catellatospora aurea TaxID=1337874 RepID=A0ABW2H7Y2_9ACTN
MTPVPMVGRAAELAELVRRWSHVRSGGVTPAAVVSITGDAGVGKSRLVTSVLAALAPEPAAVLYGVARVHTPAPYDWLAAVLSGRDTQDLPVPADGLAWLAQDPHAPKERYAPGALLRLAVRTVRALVGAGPAVLVVEDLHALDPASLNLVGELAAAPDLPALILVTSRPPDAADSPELVARTLARLSGAPGAVRQHLGPLGPADVAEIVRQVHGVIPEHLAGAVCERTGGNPYWLVELLAATAGRGPQALLDEPLPGHLRPGAAPAERACFEQSAELTAREREVLSCLAAGMSNKQMARTLDISIRTVGVHVSNLLRKTGSASRTEAALWAVRRG